MLFSCSVISDSLRLHGLQHARLFCSSPSPGACSNSCPLSRWSHPTISSSVVPFFSCFQSFPPSGSFQMSELFTSGGQSIGVSASVVPVNIQDQFPLGLTGLISLQSKGLSRIFFFLKKKNLLQHHSLKPSVLRHSAFFMAQYSHPYMTTGKNIALTRQTFVSEALSLLFNSRDCLGLHRFSSKEQASFNFMAAVTICSDFGAQENKVSHCFHCFPSICHEEMWLDAMIFVSWMLSFKPFFSLSSFTFIKRLFSSSLHFAIRVVSSAYLRLLTFLSAILIPACASSSPAIHMMYCVDKLNKQGDSIQLDVPLPTL